MLQFRCVPSAWLIVRLAKRTIYRLCSNQIMADEAAAPKIPITVRFFWTRPCTTQACSPRSISTSTPAKFPAVPTRCPARMLAQNPPTTSQRHPNICSLAGHHRVSGRRQDDAGQLHPHRQPRQEDRGHRERVWCVTWCTHAGVGSCSSAWEGCMGGLHSRIPRAKKVVAVERVWCVTMAHQDDGMLRRATLHGMGHAWPCSSAGAAAAMQRQCMRNWVLAAEQRRVEE